MKYLIILFLLISFSAVAQTGPPNIGFENGTFDNWQCYIGYVDSLGNVRVTPSSPVYNRHTLITKATYEQLDPYGEFPMLCPNGSKYSIRLGNLDTGAQAERVTYTLKVPNNNAYSIIFNYAVVLENPTHQPFQQPKFTARVFDVTDSAYIACPYFDFVASSALPGFKLSLVHGAKGSSIYYKDWTTATIDLRNYLGKTIRLEFTTNDCTLGGHFGYAYLDLDEDVGAAITGNAYCMGQTSMKLIGPNGFATYYWYNGDMSRLIGTGQSLTITPPPPDMTAYALKVIPYLNLGCVDTIYTVVNKIDEGFKLNVVDTLLGCPETGVDLTAPEVTAGSSDGIKLSYFRDPLAASYLYNPNKVFATGVYYIQGINAEGCMNILPVHVIVDPPAITVTDPPAVTFPVTVDISKTFPHYNNVVYSYFKNAETTTPLPNYTAVAYGGIYYIKAVNKVGCVNIAAVSVTIHPPPPYVITAPNAFTPNNDGINDNFAITVKGNVTFESVRIFDRYGRLVFTAKSPLTYWDGNFGGKRLPVGTYYWVFEGIDDYYRTKINKASSITLIR